MGMGVSTRTLFLMVRGVYAGRPLANLRRDMKHVNKAQQKWIRLQQRMRQHAYQQAYATLFQGVAYLSFASMIGIAFTKIMEKSRQGARTMAIFGREIDRAFGKLGTALNRILGPALMSLANLLNVLTSFPPALYALTFIAVIGTMFLGTFGAIKIVTGALQLLTINTTLFSAHLPLLNTQLNITTASIVRFGAALNVALSVGFVVYTVVKAIADSFGTLPAIIAAVALALIPLIILLKVGATSMSILSSGAAAVAGLAAVAPLLAMPTHQVGTTFVRRTGLAYVHAGETIKSARESSNAGYLKMGIPKRIYNSITVSIENVHTKADMDDLGWQLKKALREALEAKEL